MIKELHAAAAILFCSGVAYAQVGLPWPGPGTPASGGGGSAGPWTLVQHGAMNTTTVGGGTPNVDCHLATAAFVTITRYTGAGSLSAPADTSSNTYVQIGTEATSSSSTGVSLWWFHGTTANFSSSFHWGYGSGLESFSTLSGACFTDGTSPSSLDGSPTQANSANQPGSITPSGTNRLLVTGYVPGDTSAGAPTISAGFTITDAQAFSVGAFEGGAMAYQIQAPGPTSVNPTWATTGGIVGAAIMAAGK